MWISLTGLCVVLNWGIWAYSQFHIDSNFHTFFLTAHNVIKVVHRCVCFLYNLYYTGRYRVKGFINPKQELVQLDIHGIWKESALFYQVQFSRHFSSPEPKVPVPFSGRCGCWRRCGINFSHFCVIQTNEADFNQTWHKAFLGDGDSNVFKLRTMSFFKG